MVHYSIMDEYIHVLEQIDMNQLKKEEIGKKIFEIKRMLLDESVSQLAACGIINEQVFKSLLDQMMRMSEQGPSVDAVNNLTCNLSCVNNTLWSCSWGTAALVQPLKDYHELGQVMPSHGCARSSVRPETHFSLTS